MKRLFSICMVLILIVALVAPMSSAQIKVKNYGPSLNSMTAPVKGATAPAWNIQNGLVNVGVGSRSYMIIDTTGTGATGTPSWTLVAVPATSTATLDSTGTMINSIKPDLNGMYVFSATVGGKTGYDTVYASAYLGVGTDTKAGCTCHSTATGIKTAWANTPHANIFREGVQGYLEVELGKGAYAAACIKCHTTGWDPTANNFNFGYQAKANGFDTTWYKGLQFMNGDYWTTTGDSTAWKLLTANQLKVATIGCESCHGPAGEHKTNADPVMISKPTYNAAACNQCHDGARRHSLGTFFNLSAHAGKPLEDRANCQPCHTGAGFMYYLDHNKDTTGIAAVWDPKTDGLTPIACGVCHDPHDATNFKQLRTMTVRGDTLRNGYVIPANLRSNPGNLCVNCHNSRVEVRAGVQPNKPPYYGFKGGFGPHINPQGDVFYGSGGYTFGDTTITGIATHTGLEGGCVTCHMQPRMNRLDGSKNLLANHSFSMIDTTYATGVYKPTDVCTKCHGDIADFNDVQASYDFDRNGKIEGVQTEIQGLLNQLAAVLPKDANGKPVGTSRTLTSADSAKISGNLQVVGALWNYFFITNDRSMGIHNAKYAARLLYKSLGWTPLAVKETAGVPNAFALAQNYPNPFNPTTQIRFSLPTEQQVKLEVYDMTGSLVKSLINEAVRAGNKEVTWDGTNNNGKRVASGMYLYRLQAGNFSSVKKMVLLK